MFDKIRRVIGLPQKDESQELFEPTKVLCKTRFDPVEHCIGTFKAETALRIAKQLRKEGFYVYSRARGPRMKHFRDRLEAQAKHYDIPLKYAVTVSLYVYTEKKPVFTF